METSHCRAFIASAEKGTFSAAGAELGYTPSGVSQLVSSIEDELGLELFYRTKKGVSVTDAGERLLPLMREFIRQEESVHEMASELKGLTTGKVTIAAYPSVAVHWMPRLIKEFESLYPGVRINMMEGTFEEIDEWIRSRTADIAFFTDSVKTSYEWIPIAKDRMIAVLPKSHPLSGADSYPLSRTSEESFIMPALGHDEDVLYLFEKHDLSPEIRFSTGENGTTMSLIENGLGMSIMNELCTLSLKFDVVKIPVYPPESITLGMSMLSRDKASPAVKRFIDFAMERLISMEKRRNK